MHETFKSRYCMNIYMYIEEKMGRLDEAIYSTWNSM
jgi:hypothetical protein